MAYKIGDRVTLSQDVPVIAPGRNWVLRKGDSGTVSGAHQPGLYAVHFEAHDYTVLIGNAQMVHAVNQLTLLRAQLAARDAALDAVLTLAQSGAEYADPQAMNLLGVLAKHGVHPK